MPQEPTFPVWLPLPFRTEADAALSAAYRLARTFGAAGAVRSAGAAIETQRRAESVVAALESDLADSHARPVAPAQSRRAAPVRKSSQPRLTRDSEKSHRLGA